MGFPGMPGQIEEAAECPRNSETANRTFGYPPPGLRSRRAGPIGESGAGGAMTELVRRARTPTLLG